MKPLVGTAGRVGEEIRKGFMERSNGMIDIFMEDEE